MGKRRIYNFPKPKEINRRRASGETLVEMSEIEGIPYKALISHCFKHPKILNSKEVDSIKRDNWVSKEKAREIVGEEGLQGLADYIGTTVASVKSYYYRKGIKFYDLLDYETNIGDNVEKDCIKFLGKNFIKHKNKKKMNGIFDILAYINRKEKTKGRIDVKTITPSYNNANKKNKVCTFTRIKNGYLGLHIVYEDDYSDPTGFILATSRLKNTTRVYYKIESFLQPMDNLSDKNLEQYIIDIDNIR